MGPNGRRSQCGKECCREAHDSHDQRDEPKRDGVACRGGSQVHTLSLTQVGDHRAKAPNDQPRETEPHGQRNRDQRGDVRTATYSNMPILRSSPFLSLA